MGRSSSKKTIHKFHSGGGQQRARRSKKDRKAGEHLRKLAVCGKIGSRQTQGAPDRGLNLPILTDESANKNLSGWERSQNCERKVRKG